MSATRIHVPPELFAPAESSSFAGELALPELQAGPDTYHFAEPLHWEVLVTNTSDALLVAGTVRGRGTTECARCLDEFEIDVEGDVEGYFIIGDGARPDDMDEDEFDYLGEDEIIDQPVHDTGSLLYSLLSFLLPIIGLPAAFIFKAKKYYKNYRACKKGALISLGIIGALIAIYLLALLLTVFR